MVMMVMAVQHASLLPKGLLFRHRHHQNLFFQVVLLEITTFQLLRMSFRTQVRHRTVLITGPPVHLRLLVHPNRSIIRHLLQN
jgi:hypothetical protein